MLVEFEGRQIPIPMNDLLQMMGGDVSALEGLLAGTGESSSDDGIDEDDSPDSDSEDYEPPPIDHEEAIGAQDSDSDQSCSAVDDDDATANAGPASGAQTLDARVTMIVALTPWADCCMIL